MENGVVGRWTKEIAEANPLATMALSLGGLSVLVCWVPFTGLLAIPCGGFGLVVGLAGIGMARDRQGAGLRSSVAAILLVLLAMVTAVAVTWETTRSEAAEAEDRRMAALAQVAIPPPAIPQLPPEFLRFAPVGPIPDVPPRDPLPPIDVPPQGVAMGEPAVLGDIEIRVVRAERGRVRLRLRGTAPRSSQPPDTREAFLAIAIEVRTTDRGRKVDYRTLAGPEVSLLDDLGNRYRFVTFGDHAIPRGRTEAASLTWGKPVGDLLVFELPVGGASALTLEIPAEKAGMGRVSFRFEIPAGSITAR